MSQPCEIETALWRSERLHFVQYIFFNIYNIGKIENVEDFNILL